MTQNVPLNFEDVVHEGFFDPIQELLSGSAPRLKLSVTSATNLRVEGATGDSQAGVSIQGRYRYRSTNADRTVTGSAGTYAVFLTATDNDFTGAPSDIDAATDYSFGLEVRMGSSPTTPLYRKVGEVDWDGTKITALRQLTGDRDDTAMVTPTADAAAMVPVRVVGAAGQTAALVTAETSAGVSRLALDPNGQLALPAQGNTGGLLLGGDATLYRSGANALTTGGNLTLGLVLAGDGALGGPSHSFANDPDSGMFSGGANILSWSVGGTVRMNLDANGQLALSRGGATGGLLIGGDAVLYRSGAAQVTTGSLVLTGSLTGTGALAWVNTATPASGGNFRSIQGTTTISNTGVVNPAGITGLLNLRQSDTVAAANGIVGYLSVGAGGGTTTAAAAVKALLEAAGTAPVHAVTNLYGVYVPTPNQNTTGGSSITVANIYGVYVENMGLTQFAPGVVYGMFIATQGVGSVRNVGLGFTAGTTVAAGIQWGTDTPAVTLYRSAVSTLKTDAALHVGTDFRHLGSNLGFFNATVAAKQTVTGSRGGNAALASLLTALATYGLVTDSSTA